jgi:DNA polymerase III subunit chi
MTEILFYFNAPDRLGFACRVLRKALRIGARDAAAPMAGVAVTGPASVLARFDRALWSFEALEFIPHVLLPADAPPDRRRQRTPVWLVERAEQAAHLPLLLHLGDDPAEGFESFARLIEVVSTDSAEREAARARWKHYKSRRYEIRQHEASA